MILDTIKSRLVADWRDFTRWWSVRWAAFGAVMLPILTVVPSLPPEIQAVLPPSVRVGATALWCLMFIAFRVAAQKNGQ